LEVFDDDSTVALDGSGEIPNVIRAELRNNNVYPDAFTVEQQGLFFYLRVIVKLDALGIWQAIERRL
jgi:hypothetical protein